MILELVLTILCLIALLVLGVVTVTINHSVSGFATGGSQVIISDNVGVVASPPSLLPAQPAVLTIRTDGVSGSLTMTNSAHGIITGQRIDLYWVGGACYHATVGTVAGLVVPFTAVAGGTALPTAATAISVGISTLAPFIVTAANVRALIMTTSKRGYFVFSTGADAYACLVPAGGCVMWAEGDPGANPLVGAITGVYMSHDYETAAVTDMTASAVA